jgi:hypothetical protein
MLCLECTFVAMDRKRTKQAERAGLEPVKTATSSALDTRRERRAERKDLHFSEHR